MKLRELSINFCGKERTFKRCPTKELKEYQKTMEELQESLQPDIDMINDLQGDLEEDIEDYNDIEKNIIALEELKDPETGGLSEETVNKLFKLRDKKKKLRKAIKEKRKNLEKLTKGIIKDQDVANDKIMNTYDKLCTKLIDKFEPGEFKDNYDLRDQAIAAHLGTIYAIYMSNKSTEDKIKETEEIIDSQMEQLREASSFLI